MADRLVMGYWDCPYCNTKGIKGTEGKCPNCGTARTKDVTFYMKNPHEYLSKEDSAGKGKGADWMCPYCGSYNAITVTKCRSCGADKEESEEDYFSIREKQSVKQNPNHSEADRHKKEKPHKAFPKRYVFLPLAIILLMIGLFVTFSEKQRQIVVSDVSWQYNIEIEKYKNVSDSGWTLPEDAELTRSANEIHHYDQILDHYETRTRTYTVQVPDGTHTEYSYSDNGDGSFTEHAHQVQDYRTETRTEDYQEPVYRSVPVYKTKYYYKQWRWVYERDVETSGHDKHPYYGETNLKKKEREGSRTQEYAFTGRLQKKDREKTYKVDDKNVWDKITPGSTITVKMQAGTITEYVSFGK